MFVLPFSPRWLVAQGRHEEARQTLFRLHGGRHNTREDLVEAEYQEIFAQVEWGEYRTFRKPRLTIVQTARTSARASSTCSRLSQTFTVPFADVLFKLCASGPVSTSSESTCLGVEEFSSPVRPAPTLALPSTRLW